MATFAERLKALREARGLSKYALAKLTGLSGEALGRLEAGDRQPQWETVQLLAKALGVDCTAFQDEALELPEQKPAAPRGRPRKDPPPDQPSPEPDQPAGQEEQPPPPPAPRKRGRKPKAMAA